MPLFRTKRAKLRRLKEKREVMRIRLEELDREIAEKEAAFWRDDDSPQAECGYGVCKQKNVASKSFPSCRRGGGGAETKESGTKKGMRHEQRND